MITNDTIQKATRLKIAMKENTKITAHQLNMTTLYNECTERIQERQRKQQNKQKNMKRFNTN